MGAECKKQSQEEKRKQEDKLVFDPRLIFFDDDGNLRYDEDGKAVKLDEEIKDIMSTDDIIEEPNKVWYVMDTAWLAAWLAYTQTAKGVSPRPGPCRNNRLITWDEEAQAFVARTDLLMASKTWKGDYRRVSQATWNAFLKYYPGSGPAISMECSPATDKVPQIIQNWKVIDSIPAPDDLKRKKMKMRLWRSQNVLEKKLALSDATPNINNTAPITNDTEAGSSSVIEVEPASNIEESSGIEISNEDIDIAIDSTSSLLTTTPDASEIKMEIPSAEPLLSSRISSTSGGNSFLGGLRPSLSDHKPKPLVLGSPTAYKGGSNPLIATNASPGGTSR